MTRAQEKLLIALGLETLLTNAINSRRPKPKKKVVKKKRISARGRKMISIAQKKRWAKIKR